ncbi:MAG: hypothetical protein E6G56_09175 [Actinobacteria bacterium]|nr:MAG: hypothetical protein E6G56_09175 [Actinomycetota bacterium]
MASPPFNDPALLAGSPACLVCRRAISDGEQVLRVRGLSVHARCAAYRRRARAGAGSAGGAIAPGAGPEAVDGAEVDA